MPISLVILTYNSGKHIEGLLRSIFDLLGKEINDGKIELVIYDNASNDDTLQKIKNLHDDVKIIRSSENLGYAKGINEALKHTKGEIVVVVNPDSELRSFDSQKIIDKFKNIDDLAILGFVLYDNNRKKELNAGSFFNPLTFLLYSLGLERIAGQRFSPEKDMEVEFVSGGFVAFRKNHFQRLGGYDEDYFMYVEDMDICYRAKHNGLKVMFSDVASARHMGQGSSNREFAITNIYKGLITFYKKNKSGFEFFYIKSLLVIKAALIIFLSGILRNKEIRNTYTKALKAIS